MPTKKVSATATPTRHWFSALLISLLSEPPDLVASVTELLYNAVEFKSADNDDDDEWLMTSQFASLTAVPTIRLITANVPTPAHYHNHVYSNNIIIGHIRPTSCIWSLYLDTDSGSRLLPKFNGNFLVQGYICNKDFHENPITPSKDMNQIVEKCPIL